MNNNAVSIAAGDLYRDMGKELHILQNDVKIAIFRYGQKVYDQPEILPRESALRQTSGSVLGSRRGTTVRTSLRWSKLYALVRPANISNRYARSIARQNHLKRASEMPVSNVRWSKL
jgi:hypothetical protein